MIAVFFDLFSGLGFRAISNFHENFVVAQQMLARKFTLAALLIFAAQPIRIWSQETEPAKAKPGLNSRFLDPNMEIDEWLERFEVESREVFKARERVLAACQIKPGMRVADIGAGTGFYSRLFADTVGGKGWIYSVDISPRFLQHINNVKQEQKIENITTVLGTDRSVGLAPNTVDLVFICDTYHHFEFPQSTLDSLYKAMKPDAHLVVIDFERIPGKSREFILGHVRAGKDVFRREIEQAGFEFLEEVKVPSFEENYLLRFRKKN